MARNSEIQDISKRNSPRRILFASLIGPTIEFFDFYVFATAAALIFPHVFFPTQNDQLAILQSFLIFGAAFFARPLGSIIFGHFGDKIGRKATLIAALLTMGLSTVIIGFLPTYETAGWWAPFFLTLCRIGQGMGLGGEWGGAVLLATENAPPEKRGWYAMFPQLGVPIGLFSSIAVYLGLLHFLDHDELIAWGWRIPFIASIVLMFVGLWVRLSINETVAFKKTLERKERVKVPIIDCLFKMPTNFISWDICWHGNICFILLGHCIFVKLFNKLFTIIILSGSSSRNRWCYFLRNFYCPNWKTR